MLDLENKTQEPAKSEEPKPSVQTPAPDSDEIIFKSRETFNDRLARHHRSELKKSFGVETPEELKSKLELAAKYESEKEAARQAQMSKEQQMEERIALLQREADAAKARADASAFEAHTTRLFSKLGIKDHEYATYRLQQAMKSHGSDTPFSDEEFFVQLAQDPRQRISLGIEDVAPSAPSPASVPAQTTHWQPKESPKAPPAGGPTAAVDDTALDKAAWMKKKALLGI